MQSKCTLLCTLTVVIFGTSDGFLVQLFDGKDFDVSPGPDCYNFSGYSATSSFRASSLKTDVCLLVYSNDICARGVNHSILIPAGDHPDLAVFHHSNLNFDNRIASFQRCSEIYYQAPDYHQLRLYNPGVGNVGLYIDYCECVTVPEFMHGAIEGLDNYGHCVRLYSKENCQGDSVDIQGGYSDESRDLNVVNFKGLTKSFSVCGDTTICDRFSAEAFKFELLVNPATIQGPLRKIELAEKTTFRNRGQAHVTKDYGATKAVKEIFEITRVKALTSMRSMSIAKSLIIDVPSTFPISSEMKLRQVLIEAYTYTTNSTTLQPVLFTKQADFEYTASEHIQLAPCSEYTVSSYVQMVQGYSVDYIVYTKFRGQKGKRVMTSEELKNEFMGMDYVEDFDEYTIVTRSNGTIVADLGLEVIVDGEGYSLVGCLEKL